MASAARLHWRFLTRARVSYWPMFRNRAVMTLPASSNRPGGEALAVRRDVSRAEDVNAALDETVEAFGRLDFAFNNAGVEQPIAADRGGRVGPDCSREPPERVPVHEIRDPLAAQARGRRHREHGFWGRGQRHRR